MYSYLSIPEAAALIYYYYVIIIVTHERNFLKKLRNILPTVQRRLLTKFISTIMAIAINNVKSSQ